MGLNKKSPSVSSFCNSRLFLLPTNIILLLLLSLSHSFIYCKFIAINKCFWQIRSLFLAIPFFEFGKKCYGVRDGESCKSFVPLFLPFSFLSFFPCFFPCFFNFPSPSIFSFRSCFGTGTGLAGGRVGLRGELLRGELFPVEPRGVRVRELPEPEGEIKSESSSKPES